MRLLAAALLGAAALTGPITTSAAPQCVEPGQPYAAVPWQQRMLAQERAWPFTKGSGVTVAVLDSGVDAGHPQLAGRVAAGLDAVAGKGSANTDCLGTGTHVAGIIAARPPQGPGVAGVAPEATILPVRVVADPREPVKPAVLALAITWAVANGADVIDVSVASYTADESVRAAADAAQAAGVLVVAAAGDLGDAEGKLPDPYPAVYASVIAVGAIDRDGNRWSRSQFGPYLDLVAPGAEVATLQAGGRVNPAVNGTGVASAAVAGSAALVRAEHPGWTPARVRQALLRTATPGPLGPVSDEYGRGVVNPYGAATDDGASGAPVALPAPARPAPPAGSIWADSRAIAVASTAAAVLIVLAVLLAAAVLPAGRRRLWRPSLAARPPAVADSPEPAPPVPLFDDR